MSNRLSQILKYHGGKAYQAGHILSLMPPHRLYREPFFGGGAVLFRKEFVGIGEAVADVDGELMNFWRVLQHPTDSQEFIRVASMIPFSDYEWVSSRTANPPWGSDNVGQALAFFVRFRQSRQGLGKDFATPTRRIRRRMAENVSGYLSAVEGLPEAHERLIPVELRTLTFDQFIPTYDDEDALFYVDPTYLHFDNDGTKIRQAQKAYRHEMTIDQHIQLLGILANIDGKFMLSGYPSKLYTEWETQCGWRHVDLLIDNKASGSKKKELKIERIWMNF